MDERLYEDQNEPEEMMRNSGKDEAAVAKLEECAQDLLVEIGKYEQAIKDAEDALDSAEKELSEVLSELPY